MPNCSISKATLSIIRLSILCLFAAVSITDMHIFRIMTLSIMALFIKTVSIIGLIATLSNMTVSVTILALGT